MGTAEISRDRQLRLIADLKSRLATGDKDAAIMLLANLRNRPDLYYQSATDIDELLTSVGIRPGAGTSHAAGSSGNTFDLSSVETVVVPGSTVGRAAANAGQANAGQANAPGGVGATGQGAVASAAAAQTSGWLAPAPPGQGYDAATVGTSSRATTWLSATSYRLSFNRLSGRGLPFGQLRRRPPATPSCRPIRPAAGAPSAAIRCAGPPMTLGSPASWAPSAGYPDRYRPCSRRTGRWAHGSWACSRRVHGGRLRSPQLVHPAGHHRDHLVRPARCGRARHRRPGEPGLGFRGPDGRRGGLEAGQGLGHRRHHRRGHCHPVPHRHERSQPAANRDLGTGDVPAPARIR